MIQTLQMQKLTLKSRAGHCAGTRAATGQEAAISQAVEAIVERRRADCRRVHASGRG